MRSIQRWLAAGVSVTACRARRLAALLLLAGLLGACALPVGPSGAAAPATATSAATYTDPFAYCAAVGTIDAPDARYTGPRLPSDVVNGLQKALGLTGTPPPPVAQGTVWRCMDGQVYACTVGANLPCEEKANTDLTPTQEMKDFCQANPQSDVIPAVVTGPATVYEWRCTDGTPKTVKQVAQPDARGFLANIWYKIAPPGK